MKEVVSIIVPVYRAAAYIEETVKMVRAQTWKDWELLLVEDHSPDDSAEVIRRLLENEAGMVSDNFTDGHGGNAAGDVTDACGENAAGDVIDACSENAAETVTDTCSENIAGNGKGAENASGDGRGERQGRAVSERQGGIRSIEKYVCAGGQRIVLVCKEKNEGAARARNTGLDLAAGRYIAFLDADDVWYPDKLEKELHFMKDKKAGFVFSAYEFGDEQARPTGKVVHVPAELTYRQALSRTVIFTTTVLFDREKIPAKLMRMPVVESEDTAAWWQILRAGYTAYGLDEVLAVYRRPARSLSSNKAVAVRRIWNLYRRQEKLSVPASARYFVMWAYRATMRRL